MLSSQLPKSGDIVKVRTRHHLVEAVEPTAGLGTLLRLACVDDDAQGMSSEVVWEMELGTEIIGEDTWKRIGAKGFDDVSFFSSYVHSLRWNCVTATDPKLFQSPFRAGIRIDSYQLEPLRKALLMPRVNLFIADDVGLGKTIEAGLIASELLLRRRVSDIVVACPPSMLMQWKDELETRFGLIFEIMDRAYMERIRQERGFSVNPWTTYPRFLVSHKLLIDENYSTPMRDWLGTLSPNSLLILDEAHHAAPASGSRYAIDSKFTRIVRDLAGRFEHRLFLSATPHNGHSNSFSALLEILDPQRFTRGVKVVKENLDAVMVRRLKEDIRSISGGFAERRVEQIDIAGLPDDAPELLLCRLLDDYRELRLDGLSAAGKRQRNEAMMVLTHLQQRLLSSIEAFARTLDVHRRSMERLWAGESAPAGAGRISLKGPVEADDDEAELPEEELVKLQDRQMERATLAAGSSGQVANERTLLDKMAALANATRNLPDARILKLLEWIREHQCPGIGVPGQSAARPGCAWTGRRLIIFTEWDDSKRYLVNMLQAAIRGTEADSARIEVFHGPTSSEKREAIKRAFNLPPEEAPVRILVCTDAAREGLNLQAHCHDLVHFDVPWNPGRLEQRNGRIDRKLQPSPVVNCRYFFYEQRPEDRVLQTLVRKTETIQQELGSLSKVLERRLADTLENGIRRQDIDVLLQHMLFTQDDQVKAAREELEDPDEAIVAKRRDRLQQQIKSLDRQLAASRQHIGLDMAHFREALGCSLNLLGAEPLQSLPPLPGSPQRWAFPNLDTRRGADPSWSGTLDSLRAAPDNGKRDWEWRRQSPVRPVVFDPPEGIDDGAVQIHLEHRITRRLLGRFLAQGFVHHDLSRACLAQSEDSTPRVVILGRVAIYGPGAVRLHEEVIAVTARWQELAQRKAPLTPFKSAAEDKTLQLLEDGLLAARSGKLVPEEVQMQLKASLATDISQLLPHLQERAAESLADANARLASRGKEEAENLRSILTQQRNRVKRQLDGAPNEEGQLFLALPETEAMKAEQRQFAANRKYWQKWLNEVDQALVTEPARVAQFYQVVSTRVEPIGLAYLWPV
ncbi:MAG: hypothetical protein RL095_474 [Verrucomicrobiota bacterium]|jgi:hypothetical protein